MKDKKTHNRPTRTDAPQPRVTDEELETMMAWLYAIHAYGWGKCV